MQSAELLGVIDTGEEFDSLYPSQTGEFCFDSNKSTHPPSLTLSAQMGVCLYGEVTQNSGLPVLGVALRVLSF